MNSDSETTSIIGGLIGGVANSNVNIDSSYTYVDMSATNDLQVNASFNGGLIGQSGAAAIVNLENSFAYLLNQTNANNENSKTASIIGGNNGASSIVTTNNLNYYNYNQFAAGEGITVTSP